MAKTIINLKEAKSRLDKLIGKSRAHLYKPIGIAEVLYRNRIGLRLNMLDLQAYRRKSYEWCKDVSYRLYQRKPELNSRYWDQLFDPGLISPDVLEILANENRKNKSIVETYIYGQILDKYAGLLDIANSVQSVKPHDFDLKTFIGRFENDHRFTRSVDKAYEIVVYALFSTITKHLNASVTLQVDAKSPVLVDFEDFSRLVLGVDRQRPQLTQPAMLYRVGVANAADAGLDMWANFGPVVSYCQLLCSVFMIRRLVV